ncbi:VUT family protein [Mobiluncus mulieris]|uniref:VUT family protein n=1 Tax=Mobiluncus mulieris TaxID=2052 RepID=A0A7Y0U329_9ACTO|nr:VUT family protein [Mobiluncus mulieris]NMW65993.1 VUT family protein [Mobiluncus mulieris]
MNKRLLRGYSLAAAYIASIVAAAWMVVAIGAVPVGFGLYAPAAAYMVGVTMTLRDLVQDQLGRARTYVAIVAGTIISAALSPQVAFASAAGFLAAESLDMAVYTPLRERGHLVAAIIASNTAGTLVDSFLFLVLAFGSLEFFPGQVWAKILGTILSIVVLKLIYRRRADMIPAYVQAKRQEDKQREPARA